MNFYFSENGIVCDDKVMENRGESSYKSEELKGDQSVNAIIEPTDECNRSDEERSRGDTIESSKSTDSFIQEE